MGGIVGGGGGKPSHAEIFQSLNEAKENKRLEEAEELKKEQERERLRSGGRGRAANIFAGFTEDSLGSNKKKLGASA